MTLTKNHVYAILIAAALAAAYFLFAMERAPRLAFEDRGYPQGFRDLVLQHTVSPFNPAIGLPQLPREGAAAKPELKEVCDALFRDPNSPTAGNRDGPVQLVTFFDYRCPYCRTLANIMAAMPSDNVRMVFHEWAILGPPSVVAARAALAADRQGKYLAFHTRLMNSKFIPTPTFIDAIAAELGMNQAQLRTDMNSESITLALKRTSALAGALGFIGTPALVVGRTIVEGEITRPQLERLIGDEMHPPAPRPC